MRCWLQAEGVGKQRAAAFRAAKSWQIVSTTVSTP
jgi:hypothetical protein